MKKYLPYILVIAAYFAGLFSVNDPSRELQEKYQQEQNAILEVIGQKDAEIIQLQNAIVIERSGRKSDSLKSSIEVAKRDRIIIQMKKRNENRSFDSYSDSQLDSLLSRHYVLHAH